MSNSQDTYARSQRRRQLQRMSPDELERIFSGPIGTAKSVMDNPSFDASNKLRGTIAKQLQEAITSLAGYRNAPTRTMRTLLTRLCLPGKVYPWVALPEKSYDEEILDCVDDAIRLLPSCTESEAITFVRRMLRLLYKEFPIIPSAVRKRIAVVSEYDPAYQWLDSSHGDRDAAVLLNAKPAGHA
jgi:hypothetical protein